MTSNFIMNNIFENFELKEFNQSQWSADAIHEKVAPLNNCWGFIDGTVRPVCRPQKNQLITYNGDKRIPAIKCQSLVAPNGLIARLNVPYKGKNMTVEY